MGVGYARMFYQIESPAVSAFFHLGAVIPAFVEQRPRSLGQPRRRQIEQRRQRGKRPRRDDFRCGNKRIAVVDAPGDDPCRQTELANDRLQKRCFLAVALDQIDRRAVALASITRPGKPPPEPRSAQRLACGAIRASCALSRIWRPQTSSSVDGAARLMLRFHFRNNCSNVTNRSNVSRETGPAASCRLAHEAALTQRPFARPIQRCGRARR